DGSFLVGDSRGGVQQWFLTDMPLDNAERQRLLASYYSEPELDNKKGFRRIRGFAPGSGAITSIKIAEKSKSFLVADETGRVRGLNATAEHVFMDFKCDAVGGPDICYSSDLDGVLAFDSKGSLHHWWVDAPHAD